MKGRYGRMEKMKNIGVFSIMTYEDYAWDEYVSAWSAQFRTQLKARKYYTDFNPKRIKVKDWAYAHKQEIESQNLTLEQQEEMMIEDGILTRDEI